MSAPSSATTAERLNWLFDVVRPDDTHEYTTQDVARGISQALGRRDSRALAMSITELRSGRSLRLSALELASIAEFFGTSPVYFGVDEQAVTETRLGLVWTQLRRGGLERMRVCRVENLDRAQRLSVGLILLDCLRAVHASPEPHGANT